MKPESLVIADKYAAVNTFPGLVHTARQATKADCTRSHFSQPAREANVEGMIGDWG